MEAEQLRAASEHTTYAMIILGAVTTALVWMMTRVRALRDWQIDYMKKSIRSVFDMEILPRVMLKEECATTHKVTDINFLHQRDDIRSLNDKLDKTMEQVHKKLDIMLEAVLEKR